MLVCALLLCVVILISLCFKLMLNGSFVYAPPHTVGVSQAQFQRRLLAGGMQASARPHPPASPAPAALGPPHRQ